VGTRLLTILHAKILAQELGCEFKVMWPALDSQFYDNKQLLDPNLVGEIFADSHIFDLPPGERGDIVSCELPSGLRVLRLLDEKEGVARWDRNKLCAVAQQYDALIWELPKPVTNFMRFEMDIKSLARKYWALIRWNERIRESSRKFYADLGRRAYFAVHIRRGDILRMLVEGDVQMLKDEGMVMIFQRFVSMKEIIASIGRLRRDEPIIVCSDVTGMDDSLISAFGRENLHSSREIFAGTENQQAIVDIMLLSNSSYLFAPPMSFFSICAETVGVCRRFPLGADLAATVDELVAIAGSIKGERRLEVIALIRETAERHAASFVGFQGAG
jgi:hypothetical protein